MPAEAQEQRDYAGRLVCADCGHTKQLHQSGSICGAMHCYCKVFVAEKKTEESEQ